MSSSSPVVVSPTPEQYQAEITRLRTAVAEAQQAAQAAIQQAAAQQAQFAAAAVAAPISNVLKTMKVHDPKAFTGHVGADAENWLMEVERWRSAIELRGVIADSVFITSLVTFLQGTASLWWNSLEQQNKKPESWQEFKQMFRDRFRPINSERTAREALFRLRQREKDSVSTYSDAFLKLINFLPDMDLKDQMALYQRGLLPSIGDELDRVLAFAKDDSIEHLSEVINQAQRIESRLSMRRSAQAQRNYGGGSGQGWYARPSATLQGGSNNYRPTAPTLSTDSNRMDLSSMQAMSQAGIVSYKNSDGVSSNPLSTSQWRPAWASESEVQALTAMQQQGRAPHRGVPGLSKEEYDRLSREGRCFLCKGTGHLARNCDKRRLK
jgi:hypothetical protein